MRKVSNLLMASTVALSLALWIAPGIQAQASTNNADKVAPLPGQPVDLTYAAEKAIPAVVHIRYVQNSKTKTVRVQSDPFEDFFSNPFGFFGNPNGGGGSQERKIQTPKREATGSGVIISTDGYIVTNNHVVDGADELTVTLNDNREFSARIVGTDKTTDLALIKVDAKNLPTLPIGDSEKLKVGEWVIAVGNPFNLNSTVTAGIVSAKARSLYANGVESFIQTDAAINPGNSGGALVNAQGELVGINAMLYSQTGSYSGYGFAIPTAIMNKVVDDLKKYGSVQRAMLGITGSDVLNYINSQKEDGKDVDLGTNEGVYVNKVEDDGAAAEAGMVKGDVITMLDGKQITKMAEMQEVLAGKRPGDKVTITYLHNKNKHTKTNDKGFYALLCGGHTIDVHPPRRRYVGGQVVPIVESGGGNLFARIATLLGEVVELVVGVELEGGKLVIVATTVRIQVSGFFPRGTQVVVGVRRFIGIKTFRSRCGRRNVGRTDQIAILVPCVGNDVPNIAIFVSLAAVSMTRVSRSIVVETLSCPRCRFSSRFPMG